MAGKRNNSAVIGFGQMIKVVLLISFIGGAALGYVWQKNQIGRLAAQARERENTIKKLKHDNVFFVLQIRDLRESVKLMRRVSELQLGLVPRQESQVVRLEEPREPAPENIRARQLTQRSAVGWPP